MVTLGLLLNETNGLRLKETIPEAHVVLLERTLFDPPRAGPAKRWGAQIRRKFPSATMLPYVWHLVSHGTDDGLRGSATRSLSGNAYAFGHLQETPEVAQAWESARQCYQAIGATRVVLRTPSGVAPGALGRQRIQRFVAARKAEDIGVLWEPEGLWEPDEASRFAETLGIEIIARGFHGGRPVRNSEDASVLVRRDAWIRVDAMGRRPRLSADQIDAILEHAEAVPDARFVFAGARAVQNLQAVAHELESDADDP